MRVVKVMCFYDEARTHGEKHSVAINCAVNEYKQRYSQMRISATEVKRILATWRPRGGAVIFRFERIVPNKDEMERLHWMEKQFAELEKKDGLKPGLRRNSRSGRPSTIFRARFAEGPNSPRHNRRSNP